MEECIEIYVCPVSGGSFVNQIGIFTLLTDNGLKPKLCLSSSGGAVSTYVALCGHWTTNGIYRVCEDLSSGLYARSWWGDRMGKYFKSGVIGIFKDAIYNSGSGGDEMLKKYLTRDSLDSCEIWLGTYNKNCGSAEMMCNRAYNNAYVKSEDNIPSVPTRIRYLNGNMDNIAKSISASSCIPTVVPSVELQGEYFYDGGLLYASPLIPLCDYLPKCLKIIYINSFDMEKDKSELVDCSNIIKLGVGTVRETVTGLLIADKTFAIQMVTKCAIMHYMHFTDIKKALEVYREADQAVLEIYPTAEQKVDMVSFTPKDVLTAIEKVRGNYACRLWWNS
jgi:hypothetical protein